MKITHLFFIFFTAFTTFTMAGQSSSSSYNQIEDGTELSSVPSSTGNDGDSSKQENTQDKAAGAQEKKTEGSGSEAAKGQSQAAKPEAKETTHASQSNSNDNIEYTQDEDSFLVPSGVLVVILMSIFGLL